MRMKVVDFIKKLEELGYNDETELNFFVSTYDGDSYLIEIDEVEDRDRQYDCGNSIDVDLADPPRAYFEYYDEGRSVDFITEVKEKIGEICAEYGVEGRRYY